MVGVPGLVADLSESGSVKLYSDKTNSSHDVSPRDKKNLIPSVGHFYVIFRYKLGATAILFLGAA